jgi:hypothetical protein
MFHFGAAGYESIHPFALEFDTMILWQQRRRVCAAEQSPWRLRRGCEHHIVVA